MEIVWKKESHFGATLQKWWEGLDNDRASRAMLRRCATLDDVILCPAYQKFYRFMLSHNWPHEGSGWQNDKLAVIAGLLARVKESSNKNLPKKMSEVVGERPLVSEMRFRNILKAENSAELFHVLVRVLPLLDDKADIHQLAHDVYKWGDKLKKDWAYEYVWPIKRSA